MTALTQKCQVTIPKQFRIAVGLMPGDEVEFAIENDKVVLKKKAKKIPFEKWRGCLGTFDTDSIMEELRGGIKVRARRDDNRS